MRALGCGTREDPRRVVEVWPVVRTAAGWRLLLLRRAPDQGDFWQGVSGKIEEADASPEEACRRELHEETGLRDVESLAPFGSTRIFEGYDGVWYLKRSFVAVLRGVELPSIILSNEHLEAALCTWDEALARLTIPAYRPEIEALREHLARRER